MGHTPGPWEADNEIIFSDFGTIATVSIDMADKEANTYLIVAAPEQNAELVSVLRCIERDDFFLNQEVRPSGGGVRVFLTYKQIKRIRAAITKAESKASTINKVKRETPKGKISMGEMQWCEEHIRPDSCFEQSP